MHIMMIQDALAKNDNKDVYPTRDTLVHSKKTKTVSLEYLQILTSS